MSKSVTVFLSFIHLVGFLQAFDINKKCAYSSGKLVWIHKLQNLPPSFSSNFIDLYRHSYEVLGEGAFGVVKQVSLDKDKKVNLAVKRVKTSEVKSDELEVLEQLSGLNVSPNFYGCNQDSNYIYLAQDILHESLDHASTLTMIRRKSEQELFAFFKTFFDALFAMFKKGWVHNDIKPANIMTDELLKRIFLIDFGLSQQTHMSNNGGGTPLFMNFGRRKNSRISRMTDLYAAAVSVAVIMSSNDSIFFNVSEKSGYSVYRLPNECYVPNKNHFARQVVPSDKLHQFCVNNIRSNVISALKNKFGEYKSGATDENINFTTLMAWIVEYEFRKGVTADLIQEKMEVIAKRLKIHELEPPVEPPRQIFEQIEAQDDDFKSSRALNTKRQNILHEMHQIKGEVAQIGEPDDDQRDELEKKYGKMWADLKDAERAHVKASNLYQDKPQLFERQFVVRKKEEEVAVKAFKKDKDRPDSDEEGKKYPLSDKAFKKQAEKVMGEIVKIENKEDYLKPVPGRGRQILDLPLKKDESPSVDKRNFAPPQKEIARNPEIRPNYKPTDYKDIQANIKPAGKPSNYENLKYLNQFGEQKKIEEFEPVNLKKYVGLRKKPTIEKAVDLQKAVENKLHALNLEKEAYKKHQERFIKFIKPEEFGQMRKNIDDLKYQRQPIVAEDRYKGVHGIFDPLLKKLI